MDEKRTGIDHETRTLREKAQHHQDTTFCFIGNRQLGTKLRPEICEQNLHCTKRLPSVEEQKCVNEACVGVTHEVRVIGR